MRTVGQRVGVIIKAGNGEVWSLGEGVYEGYIKLPKKAVGFNFGQKNPRIKLDNGKFVYGCECWWGDLDTLNKYMKEWLKKGYKIINIDIDEHRKKEKKK